MAWCPRPGAPDIWYEEMGTGPALVLVHGWSMSSAVWRPLIECLGSRLRVLMPDMPGHGKSVALPGEGSIDSWGTALASFVRNMGLNDALLVGWSMGGMAAIAAYTQLVGVLAGLVLMNSTPSFVVRPDFPHGLTRYSVNGMEAKLRRRPDQALADFRRLMFTAEEKLGITEEACVREVLESVLLPDTSAALHGLKSLANQDLRPHLHKISHPVLVIAGGDDGICPPDASRWMCTQLPAGILTVLRTAGHAPHLTMPAVTAQLLLGFIERTGRLC